MSNRELVPNLLVVRLGNADDKAAITVAQMEGRSSSIETEPDGAFNAREGESTEGLDSRGDSSILKEAEGSNVLINLSRCNIVDSDVVVEESEELDGSGLVSVGIAEIWGAGFAIGGGRNVEDEVTAIVLDLFLCVDWVDGWVLDSEWRSIVLRSGERSGSSNGSEEGSNEDLGELHIENYKVLKVEKLKVYNLKVWKILNSLEG